MDTIFVTNTGSSSVKFEVFRIGPGRALTSEIAGKIEGVGTRPYLIAKSAEGKVLVERIFTNEVVPDVPAALYQTGNWLRGEHGVHPIAVGHRVVHGGPDFDKPVLVTEDIIRRLERYIPLAPLHQPHNLASMRSIMKTRPGLPQVACFDTAFHRTHSAVADHFAIPLRFYEEGVRRYGFHGLSYEYIARRLKEIAPGLAQKKVIAAHLGNGTSLCAMQDGRSVESTMGFTALDGLPMGTRPGQIDPGVLLYLLDQHGMSGGQLQDFLYHDCGFKGLSGISNDMRELEASADPRAAFAIEYFVYRIALYTGAFTAALGGLDAFIFTAGIGENSAYVRARVAGKLSWLGVRLDEAANTSHKELISTPDSRVAVYVLPTDEELTIAGHTLALVRPAD